MLIDKTKFSKIKKLQKPIWKVQFVDPENFVSAYYAKLQENSCYFLLKI